MKIFHIPMSGEMADALRGLLAGIEDFVNEVNFSEFRQLRKDLLEKTKVREVAPIRKNKNKRSKKRQ